MFSRRRNYESASSSRDSARRERRDNGVQLKKKKRRGLSGFLWDFLSWFGFLLAVSGGLAGAGFYFLHSRFDEALRVHVEAKFRAGYPQHVVSLRAARRVEGQGIELRGLEIRERGEDGGDAPVVTAGELLLECNAGLEDLVSGKMAPKRVVIRHLQLQATRDLAGEWNLSRLFPLPRMSKELVPIRLEGATVQLSWGTSDGMVPIVTEIPALDLTPLPQAEDTSVVRAWQFAGTLGGKWAQQITVQGEYDVGTRAWRTAGEVVGAQVNSEWLALLPQEFAGPVSWLKSADATVQGRFDAASAESGSRPVRFQVDGEVAGRIEDTRLPFPLTDLNAKFHADDQSLEIRDARAKVGQATLGLTCQIGGFRADAPCNVKLTARKLQVSRQLADTLPQELRRAWSLLSPEGELDAEVSLAFDGQEIQQRATLDCRNVAFAYEKFPYRLQGGQGRVEWEEGQLTFKNFKAFASGREVLFSGEITQPGPQFLGWITVDAPVSIPIDEELVQAIPESARRVVQQLKPFGQVTLQARFERHASEPTLLRRQLTIGLQNCAINYELFPYRLYEIQGTIGMTDGQWSVRDLRGVNDSAEVTCNGGWGPDESGALRLALEFNAQDVPLTDELRDALKPEAQAVWKNMRPRGTIDQVRAQVRYHAHNRKTDIDLTAVKHPAAANIKERSISVKPTWLPYQMDDVEGTLHSRNGVVEFRHVRGRHNETVAQLNGVATTGADGQWEVSVEPLTVERARVSHELATALPPRLGAAITKLNVTGPFSMTGNLLLTGRTGDTTPLSTQWDLEFDLDDGGVDCGVRLEHVRGGLHLVGSLDGRGLSSRGNLQIDSLVYRGLQFSQVTGPISLEDDRLGFGEASSRVAGDSPPLPIQAKVFAGTVLGSGEVRLVGDFPFDISSQLIDGDLALISREATSRRHDISGRTYADLQLQGNGHGAHTLRGAGNVRLRQADIYELPVMARLLKVLTISPPNATAFTSSDVRYHIEGDRVYLDQIVFAGDVISLTGRGEMSLDGALNLTFATELGREDFSDLLLRPLLKEAGKRLVQIQVSGTLAEPLIEKQLVPQLNDTLQTLFPGGPNGSPRPTMSRLPKPGEVFDKFTPK